MKGLMRFLAKARLVELSDDELADAGTESPVSAINPVTEPLPVEPEPVAVSLPVSPDGNAVVEGLGFDIIYTNAGLPHSPFPAERLLKLLDGLRAMDAATRKMAVLAMDAADDSWVIDDPIADAGLKIRILDGYKQSLTARIRETEEQTAARISEVHRSQAENADIIRRKMTELEQLLQEDIAQSARQAGELEAALRASRETAAREARRVDQEIERLREIPAHFTPPATPSTQP